MEKQQKKRTLRNGILCAIAILAAFFIVNGLFSHYGSNNPVHQQVVTCNAADRPLNEADLSGFTRSDFKFAVRHLTRLPAETAKEKTVLAYNTALVKAAQQKNADHSVKQDTAALDTAEGNDISRTSWRFFNHYSYTYNQTEPSPWFSVVPGTVKDCGLYYTVTAKVYYGTYMEGKQARTIKKGQKVTVRSRRGKASVFIARDSYKKGREYIRLWPADSRNVSYELIHQVDGTWYLYKGTQDRVLYYAGAETLSVRKGSYRGTGNSFAGMLSQSRTNPGSDSYCELTEAYLNSPGADAGKVWNTVIFDENDYVVGLFQIAYPNNLRTLSQDTETQQGQS